MSGYKFELMRDGDRIQVEILEDGTIKTETDKVSAANHLTADNFLAAMFTMAGGKTEVRFKRGVPVQEAGHHNHHHSH